MDSLFLAILGVNLLAAGLMAYDKWAAPRGHWRVPEKTLFTLSALGASPTVLLLINYLRHKSRKQSFQRQLHLIIVAQMVLAALWLANNQQ